MQHWRHLHLVIELRSKIQNKSKMLFSILTSTTIVFFTWDAMNKIGWFWIAGTR